MNIHLKASSIILVSFAFIGVIWASAMSVSISIFGYFIAGFHDAYTQGQDWMPDTQTFFLVALLSLLCGIVAFIFGLKSSGRKVTGVVPSYILLSMGLALLITGSIQLLRILNAISFMAEEPFRNGTFLFVIIAIWYLNPSLMFISAFLLIRKMQMNVFAANGNEYSDNNISN